MDDAAVQARPRPAVTPPPAPALDFGAVYAEGFDHVWHTLRRLGVHERDLEDKAHDVFLVVHRRLSDFVAGRRVTPWLTGICYRVASDYRRSARYRREVVADDVRVAATTRNPEECAAQAEAKRQVQVGLEALPMEQRVVFVMHDIQGASIPEIAQTLSVSNNTLYSRLRLARKKFSTAIRGARRGAYEVEP